MTRWARLAVGAVAVAALVLGVLTPPLAAEHSGTPEDHSFQSVAAVDGVVLTPAGYRRFVRRINDGHLDFAQGFTDFNPRRVDIRQGPSRVFVWHFTAEYFNRDGASLTPRGDPSPRQLVRLMARRYGVCCAVNWFIDRNARVHRLAPLNAKLRHNPPYDAVNTGVEVEAVGQHDVTSAQYEQLAYLTVHVLHRQRLLRAEPLRRIVRGHGEMRDAYLARNPQARWDGRDDFDAPLSQLLRDRIDELLTANPQLP